MTSLMFKKLKDLPEAEVHEHYAALMNRFPIGPISDVKENAKALTVFRILVRMKKSGEFSVGETEAVNKYLNGLKVFIKKFEDETYVFEKVTPIDILKDLMERHSLTQSDFKEEIGRQPIVSKILHNKATLSAEMIGKLAKRFSLSPAVFYESP